MANITKFIVSMLILATVNCLEVCKLKQRHLVCDCQEIVMAPGEVVEELSDRASAVLKIVGLSFCNVEDLTEALYPYS